MKHWFYSHSIFHKIFLNIPFLFTSLEPLGTPSIYFPYKITAIPFSFPFTVSYDFSCERNTFLFYIFVQYSICPIASSNVFLSLLYEIEIYAALQSKSAFCISPFSWTAKAENIANTLNYFVHCF